MLIEEDRIRCIMGPRTALKNVAVGPLPRSVMIGVMMFLLCAPRLVARS